MEVKPFLIKVTGGVVLTITVMTIGVTVFCGARSSTAPELKTAEASFCEGIPDKGISVMLGVMGTLLALLVKTDEDDGPPVTPPESTEPTPEDDNYY